VATVPRPKNQAQAKSAGHGRKYGEKPSHVIPLWNGILEHRGKIGPALWEFIWCLDKITFEDEHGIGWCLGRTPIDTKRIAGDLCEHPDTAYDNLSRLAAEGYIIRKRTPRGYAIGVTNSRKINAFRHLKSDSEKIPNHSETDSEKTPNQSASDSEKTPRVIRSFPESDSEETPIRRDYAVTLQEDSAERERPSAEEARASDSAELASKNSEGWAFLWPDQTQETLSLAKTKPRAPNASGEPEPEHIDRNQISNLRRHARERGWDAEILRTYVRRHYGLSCLAHLSFTQYNAMMDLLHSLSRTR
jgi:hypothetical protein